MTEDGSDPRVLRTLLEQERQPLAERIEQLRRGRAEPAVAGLDLGRAYAAVLDKVLLAATPLTDHGIALAGVGGYGRGAVALGADLDVRLLTRDIEQAEEAAQALLYPLWDARLSVGHQVVTIDDLIEASRDDLPTATTLLDWRFVKGDQSLSDQLLTRARGGIFSVSELRRFLDRLETAMATRHKRFGGSVYMLEPDVKNGPGALRDVDHAWWAARARWSVTDFDALVRLGVLVPRQLAAVSRARETLWRVRNLLHERAGRRSDRLGFDAQEDIAPLLGYDGPLGEAVEHMMSDYYRAARTISRFHDLIFARARPNLKRRRPSSRDIGVGVQLFDGEATLTDHQLLEDDPAIALRLIDAAVEHGVPIRPSIRNVLVGASGDPSWAERLRADDEAAQLFVELVSSRRETNLKRGTIMREMHDLGLLLAMVPEFAPLVGRVHHDTYHVYTVDVHSLAAVDRLGEIFRGDIVLDDQEGDRWAGSLAMRVGREVVRPTVLYFATLLHDIGKAIGRREHSERGAEMARDILARLPFADADIDDVCSLVHNHLAMYHIATRRDLDDPATHQEVARLVGNRDGLRNLYLLTVADLSTTSPKSMTSWKARMLDELFIATDRWFQDEEQPSAEQRWRHAVDGMAEQIDAAPERAFLERYAEAMPARYVLAGEPGSVLQHAELVRCHLADEATASVALVSPPSREAVQLCVVAEDRPGVLADIAAALAAARLQVHAAQIHSCRLTTSSGDTRELAVDIFWLQSGAEPAGPGSLGGVERQIGKLQRELRSLLAGGSDAATLVRSRRRRGRRERGGPAVATRILVDNRASPKHTVVEVLTRDRPGLLFALSHAIYSHGLSIAVAKIATEGTRVVDVFYVNERNGDKVPAGDRTERLRSALVDTIEGMD